MDNNIEIIPIGSELYKALNNAAIRIKKGITSGRFDFARLSKPNSSYFRFPIKIIGDAYVGIYHPTNLTLIGVVVCNNPCVEVKYYLTTHKQEWYRAVNGVLNHSIYHRLLNYSDM